MTTTIFYKQSMVTAMKRLQNKSKQFLQVLRIAKYQPLGSLPLPNFEENK